MTFFYQDDSERWLNDILENHEQEARMRVFALIAQGEPPLDRLQHVHTTGALPFAKTAPNLN